MNEIQQITKAFNEALARGEAAALATVVAVSGSAYRRPGARMLVSDDGHRVGSVSGGCLERDVVRRATLAINNGEAALRLYDSLDEDLADGFALGCNGAVLVLIEPPNANVRHQIRFQGECLQRRRRGAIATVYASHDACVAEPGGRLSQIEGDETFCSGIGAGPLRAALEAAVTDALRHGRSGDWSFATGLGTVSAFIEVLAPPLRVMVFGAGQDVHPLVEFGRQLGWCMQVVANAGGFELRQRFRSAETLYFGSPGDAVDALKPDGDTIALLMSHNFPLDVAAFRALAPIRPRYIGLLGPRHRALRLLEEVQAQGTPVDEALRASVFGPVGLDIGAETPAEVALAIVAEINATLRGRNGTSARLRPTALHMNSAPLGDLRATGGISGEIACGLATA